MLVLDIYKQQDWFQFHKKENIYLSPLKKQPKLNFFYKESTGILLTYLKNQPIRLIYLMRHYPNYTQTIENTSN